MIYTLKNKFSNFKYQNFIKDYFWRFLQIFSKQIVTFFLFFFTARFLYSPDFGLYNYLFGLVGFFVLFGDFGISLTTSKFVSETDDFEQLKKIFFNSFLIIFFASLLMSIAFGFFIFFFKNEYFNYLWYLISLIFLMPLTSWLDGFLRGLRRFKELAKIFIFSNFFTLLLGIYLILNFKLEGAFLAQIIFYLILVIKMLILLKDFFNFQFNKTIVKKILSYGSLVGLSMFGHFLYNQFDILILGQFAYFNQLNYFKIITKITLLGSLLFSIFGNIIAPVISKLSYNKNNLLVSGLFRKTLKISLIISFSLSFFLYILFPFFFKIFLPNLFNQDFLNIFYILIFLIPFNIVSELIDNGFIVPAGMAKINLLTLVFGVLNVLLSLLLIVKFGFIGVAYSNLLIGISSKFVIWWLFDQKLKRRAEII
jgi:PST family polysaccharide transporter